jgi:uncharacterized protein YbjT (DUF2867 family)
VAAASRTSTTIGAVRGASSLAGAAHDRRGSDHPMKLFRMKAAAEMQLRRSGLPWTIVRAGAHLDLYQELLRRSTADLVGC